MPSFKSALVINGYNLPSLIDLKNHMSTPGEFRLLFIHGFMRAEHLCSAIPRLSQMGPLPKLQQQAISTRHALWKNPICKRLAAADRAELLARPSVQQPSARRQAGGRDVRALPQEARTTLDQGQTFLIPRTPHDIRRTQFLLCNGRIPSQHLRTHVRQLLLNVGLDDARPNAGR